MLGGGPKNPQDLSLAKGGRSSCLWFFKFLEVLPHQREDTVNSLAYEAEARIKDPVYGCVGAISGLQKQLFGLQKELDATNADLIQFTLQGSSSLGLGHVDHSHDFYNYPSNFEQ
ncbi:hypothetical protein P8452_54351 [Trifolium repens]|nr:hypothetical protein P8452_54351 [Trifolium repens]